MAIEQWKDIDGYEGIYKISNFGNVLSVKNNKLRAIHLDKDGYCRVMLCKNGRKKSSIVHRLVANAFIPNLENKPQVNHKNGIKTDNRLENLEWVTNSENMKHAFLTGLKKYTNECREAHKKFRKLTDEQVEKIRYFRKAFGWGPHRLSKVMGIPASSLNGILYYDCYKF